VPKFTREELELERSRDSNVTVQYNVALNLDKSKLKLDYRSTQDTKELVLFFLHKFGHPLSRADIARLIKRRKSPGLSKLLNQMANDGDVRVWIQQLPNGTGKYVYEIMR
jgi:hypothetical protein